MASLFARRKRRSPVSACRTSLDKWSAVWLLFLTTFLPLVVVVAAAQGQDGSDSSVIQLQHGQAHVLSAGQDETVRFVYPVHDDAKHVYCAMSGADETGDADLYVRWSQPVDFDDAEMNACAPRSRGSDEVCTELGTPIVGNNVLHLGIAAYRAFDDVSVLCVTLPQVENIDAGGTRPTTTTTLPDDDNNKNNDVYLEDNVWIDVAGQAGDDLVFYYRPAAGATSVKIRLKRGSGNANLHAYSTGTVCRAENPTNDEECLFVQFGSRIEIHVKGVTNFKGATLKARSFFV